MGLADTPPINKMKRSSLEKLIDDATRRFSATQDPPAQDEVERLTVRLTEVHYFAVLEEAVTRCRDEDMRTSEVKAALHFLIYRSETTRPFQQFREGLDSEDAENRCQLLNAALDGIRAAFALGIEPDTSQP